MSLTRSAAVLVAPVVRRTAGGAGRGGGAIDYDGVRSTRDGYELLLVEIMRVPLAEAIADNADVGRWGRQ